MTRLWVVLGLAAMLCGNGIAHAQEAQDQDAQGVLPGEEVEVDNRGLYRDGLDAYESERFDRAYVVWKPLAENGYAPAQYSLGKLFDEGGGSIRPNPFMAALWYRQAAAQEVAAAQNNLAIMYAKGRGVPLNQSRAVELWEQAASNGHAVAKFNLALSYFNGDGVAVDRESAVGWFREAADDGVADAQFALGQLHRQGVGVSKDLGLARGWYEMAAQQGHSEARLQYDALVDVEPRQADEVPPLETAAAGDLAEDDAASPATVAETAEAVATADDGGAGDLSVPATASEAAGQEGAEASRGEAETESHEDTQVAALPAQAETLEPEGGAGAGPGAVTAPAVAEQPAAAESVPPVEAETADAAPTEDVIAALIETQATDTTPAEEGGWVPPPPRRKPQLALAGSTDAGGSVAAGSAESTPGAPAASQPATPEDSATAIETANAGATAPAVAPPQGSFMVWLATTREEAAAEGFWAQARESYPEIFSAVEATIEPVEIAGSGVNYRLLAGPLPNLEAGQSLCQALRSRQNQAFCVVRQN